MHAARIDAEQFDHLDILRRGADRGPDARALDAGEHQCGDAKADAEDRDAIGGVGKISSHMHGKIQHRRHRDAVELVVQQGGSRFLEQQDQREGQQHLVEMLALAKAAEQGELQHRAEQCTADQCGRQRQPERAGHAGDRIGEIGADHEQAAVREVDHAHHAEDERKAAADQEQQQPVLQSVQDLGEQAGKLHQPSLQPVPGSANASAATPITRFSPPLASRR